MDLLKALKRTTLSKTAALSALGAALSVMFVLALWPTNASASAACNPASGGGDCTAVLGHISASVVGTLGVNEISAINFGNMTTTGACAVAPTIAAGTATASYLTLSDRGVLTAVGCITPMYGANNGGGAEGVGSVNATGQTGGQSPGFYAITGADINGTNVYISFANANGQIVDSCYGSGGLGASGQTVAAGSCAGNTTTYTHPNNVVALAGPSAAADFVVNQFTFEADDGTDGYTQATGGAATWDTANNSGNYITLAAGSSKANIRVGATLIPIVAAPVVGKHTGTFYVMVSY